MSLVFEPTFTLREGRGASPVNLPYKLENVVRFRYTWENIPAGDVSETLIIRSPDFSIQSSSGIQTTWSLRLYPTGVIANEGYMSLFLRCESSDRSAVKAKFRFHADDSRGVSVRSLDMEQYCEFKCGTESESCGYKNFCLTNDSPSRYLTRIQCHIEILLDNSNSADQCDEELRNGIAAVFLVKKHSDFTIINSGTSFPVHKVILSARSPMFAAMFESDTKEQRTNSVNMNDMTPEAFKEMLRYIYTGKVEGIGTVALDLLVAAEKYALDGLKVICEKALGESLVVENAAETLIQADLHQAKELKARAIDFITRQSANAMNTTSFQSMIRSHPHLTAGILHALMSKTNGVGDVSLTNQ